MRHTCLSQMKAFGYLFAYLHVVEEDDAHRHRGRNVVEGMKYQNQNHSRQLHNPTRTDHVASGYVQWTVAVSALVAPSFSARRTQASSIRNHVSRQLLRDDISRHHLW